MSTAFDCSGLVSDLEQLTPRARQAIAKVALEGRTFDEAAAWFGISLSAFEILFYRAVQEHHVSQTGDEARAAHHLRLALSQGCPVDNSELEGKWRWIEQLKQQRDTILREQERRAALEDSSPAAARRERVRRLAIVVLVVVSAYFYWKQHAR